MKNTLLNKYKDNICPVCKKNLIFKADYTEVNCMDIECSFNKEINFEEIYKKQLVKYILEGKKLFLQCGRKI